MNSHIHTPPRKCLRVGLIGIGVVGKGVLSLLEANKALITARTGVEIIVTKGVVRDKSKHTALSIPLTESIDDVLDDDNIDVIIELIGGTELPYYIAKTALLRKKAFITANKAMLAYHRYELAQLAQSPIGFEASVCGGIPIINALKEGLSANHILAIRGILNGTSNYILTKMTQEGLGFKQALEQAQNLGYAEADPSLDIHGLDAAHKLSILASIAYGINIRPEDMLIEGITHIAPEDIAFAKEFDYCIKLLGIAKKHHNAIELRVHPTMIHSDTMLAKVSGVMNAVSVIGDYTGESVYYGAGAGGEATASSVVSDLIALARRTQIEAYSKQEACEHTLGFTKEQCYTIIPRHHITSKYYMRILADDKPGVLEKIAAIFTRHSISISTFLQKPSTTLNATPLSANALDATSNSHAILDTASHISTAKILLSTHSTTEQALQQALLALQSLDVVRKKPSIIRIEE